MTCVGNTGGAHKEALALVSRGVCRWGRGLLSFGTLWTESNRGGAVGRGALYTVGRRLAYFARLYGW